MKKIRDQKILSCQKCETNDPKGEITFQRHLYSQQEGRNMFERKIKEIYKNV